MKNIFLSLLALFIAISNLKAQKPFELNKSWSLSGFEAPESVLVAYDYNVLFVSNVNGNPGEKDGNGYISKISKDGKLIRKKWATKLNAPKGMGIYKGKLYVADITDVVEIDMSTGYTIKRYPAPGATFLNDIAIGKNGEVYISNTFGGPSIIYRLYKGELTEWLNDDKLNLPNGLLADDKYLYVDSWGTNPNPKTFATETPGKLIRVTIKSKNIEILIDGVGNMDGLTKTIHGKLMSDWIAGKLIYTKDNRTTVDILDVKQGSADISFDRKTKTVYVPQMLDGVVDAYHID